MKRIVLTVLFIMFLCLSVSTYASATAFSIIDGTFEITGKLSYWDNGSHSVGQYYISSTSPVSYRIDDTVYEPERGWYQQSTASWAYVGFAGYIVGDIGASGSAKSTVRFTTSFDGVLGKDILFYGLNDDESGPAPTWSLKDLTTNTLLALNSPDLPSDFSQSFILGTDQWWTSPYTVGYDYYWDSTHIYELELFVTEETNCTQEYEWVATNMFAVNVPEPAAIFLLGTSLLGLVWTSRKKFKK